MTFAPNDTCTVCDGSLVGGPKAARCQCDVPPEQRAGPTFAAWYLRENPGLAERLGETDRIEPARHVLTDRVVGRAA